MIPHDCPESAQKRRMFTRHQIIWLVSYPFLRWQRARRRCVNLDKYALTGHIQQRKAKIIIFLTLSRTRIYIVQLPGPGGSGLEISGPDISGFGLQKEKEVLFLHCYWNSSSYHTKRLCWFHLWRIWTIQLDNGTERRLTVYVLGSRAHYITLEPSYPVCPLGVQASPQASMMALFLLGISSRRRYCKPFIFNA